VTCAGKDLVAQGMMGREVTAQSKGASSMRMGCTENWNAREVGSAYLFEKLRGRVEREAIKGRRLQHTVANDDDGPKLRCTASDSEEEGLKLRPAQEFRDSYAPNSSRKRRKLRTDSVEALWNYLEGIKLVGKQDDDRKEIRDLGYVLIFKTLRAILLILLAIVQLGAVGAGQVERWLDKGYRRECYSNKVNTINSKTDLQTDIEIDSIIDDTIDPIDIQEHLINSKDLLYTMFLLVSILLAILLTPLSSSSS
jgi:hypothetical protein